MAVRDLVVAATGWPNVYLGQRIRGDQNAWINDFRIPGVPASPGPPPVPEVPPRFEGATISWGAITENAETNCENLIEHEFVVRAIRGAEIDSDLAFRITLEDIQKVVRDSPLPPPSGLYEWVTPIRIPEPEYRVFGSVLCHYAELRFTAVERVLVTR